jgi:hypothetical protein
MSACACFYGNDPVPGGGGVGGALSASIAGGVVTDSTLMVLASSLVRAVVNEGERARLGDRSPHVNVNVFSLGLSNATEEHV